MTIGQGERMVAVGIDVGGTFTDCVVVDDTGLVVTVAKSPTQRKAIEEGAMASLEVAARQVGTTLPQFLSQIEVIVHGSTVATNALVERRGVKAGLVTTRGHEDVLLIGKVVQKVAGLSEREIINQAGLKKPVPLIPRRLSRGAVERIDCDGDVVVSLYEEQAMGAVDELVDEGIEALAVSLLWSFINPEHEQRLLELCKARYPDLYVVSSHEIAPLLGEYERTATAALSAYVGPVVTAYLGRLDSALHANGYAGKLLLAHGGGGVTSINDASRHPLLTLDSGPASGVVGAQHIACANGAPNVICADMGGTSLDVSLIKSSRYIFDEEPVISQYHYLNPKIKVNSVGAGGGSIVRAEDGLVRVGPQSAGAEPGPACYGKGGTAATVTDVDVFLGFLSPEGHLGGRQLLDTGLAEQALGRIGGVVDESAAAVACGAFAIVNAQMADLISAITVENGRDPRDFSLFPYGGAAGCHIAYLARELGIDRVWISPHASVFSALGMLCGGVVHSAERTFRAHLPLEEGIGARLVDTVDDLRCAVSELFHAEGIASSEQEYSGYADVKYAMQPKAIPVEMANWSPEEDAEGWSLVARFEESYSDLYGEGTGYPDAGFEVVRCSVTGSANRLIADVRPAMPEQVEGEKGPTSHSRRVLFPEIGEFEDCPVVPGNQLAPGTGLKGPCVLERMGDTIVIPAFAAAEVDVLGNILLTVDTAVSVGAGTSR